MHRRIRKLLLDYFPLIIKAGLIKRVPSLYSFLEIQPTSCTVVLTDRCNLRCIMCKQWRKSPEKELLTEDWRGIISDLARNRIRNIHFTGGEPLLRQESLQELIPYSHEKGITSGFTTNGLLLNEGLLKSLIESGLKSVALSVDALDDEYDLIRGMRGSFARLKDAAFLISSFKRKNFIDAYINFTLMKGNIDKFRDVKRFADDLNLPVAVCLLDKNSYLFDIDENKADFWISEAEDFNALKSLSDFLIEEKINRPASLLLNFPMIAFIERYFKDPRQARIPCISSQDRIIVDPYGNLKGGCLSMSNFGNLKDSRFAELKREKGYISAKRNMFCKKCRGCSCGYQFNIKLFTPLIVNDIIARIGYTWTKKN